MKKATLKIDAKVVDAMVQQSLELLNSGDIVIFKDVMYFDRHADASREIAEPLYKIFKCWALGKDAPLTFTTFYRIYFSALGKMNANKQVSLKINQDDLGVYVMRNQKLT
jgi:hypothetical protein